MIERNEDPDGFGINGVIPGDGECVIVGCDATCHEDALMCHAHWRQVPQGPRTYLRYIMGRWNRSDGVSLKDLRDAQWACVDSITPEQEQS